MGIITSPAVWNIKDTGGEAVFLAGGISNCPDWQSGIAEKISAQTDLTVINPRRLGWDMNAADSESRKQITWEYVHLRQCRYTLFWFPKETDGPITLFELGSALERETKLTIGCHPDYNRLLDVETQVALRRSDLSVVQDLEAMVERFIEQYNSQA